MVHGAGSIPAHRPQRPHEREKIMSTEFDYRSAWREAAKPAFDALPKEIVTLFRDTCEIAKDLGQDSNGCVFWPEDGNVLRERFAAFDDEALAIAARVVYGYGHWASGSITETLHGGTWKFSHYCDQVLRSRMGLERAVSRGLGFAVHEGELRVCIELAWSWSWSDVALATRDNLDKIRKLYEQIKQPEPGTRYEARRKEWDAFTDKVLALSKKLGREFFPKGEPFAACFDTSRFMVPSGTLASQDKAKRQEAVDAKLEPKIKAMADVVHSLQVMWADDPDRAKRTVELFLHSTGASHALTARVMTLVPS